jgi:hypothetical protein
MSEDKRGNGIQEVDGSIPFGSTSSNNNPGASVVVDHPIRTGRCDNGTAGDGPPVE